MLFTEEWRWFEDALDRLAYPQIPKPQLTYKEEDGKVTAELDLPGVKKEDLTIEVNGDRLLVTAKRGGTTTEKTILVHPKYDVESASATLADGVLTLVFEPKKAPEKTLIEVK